MKKFFALLMVGVFFVSCAGAALAVHDSTTGTSTPSVDTLVVDMTPEQQTTTTNTAVEALTNRGNSTAAAAFKNATVATVVFCPKTA